MKQKDIALIGVIIFISALVAFLISKSIFGAPQSSQMQAESVQPIVSSFPAPDKAYFNDQAFDPTQTITITQNANTDPFSNGSH